MSVVLLNWIPLEISLRITQKGKRVQNDTCYRGRLQRFCTYEVFLQSLLTFYENSRSSPHKFPEITFVFGIAILGQKEDPKFGPFLDQPVLFNQWHVDPEYFLQFIFNTCTQKVQVSFSVLTAVMSRCRDMTSLELNCFESICFM